jgi:hypothetical protein
MVDWGDGVIDSIPYAGGLVRVAGPIDHQYAIVGTYEIVGTVEAANGVLSDQASIEIN